MELHWPLILFTFFLCVAGGIMFGQGLATVLGKGEKTQVASLISAFVSLVVGGIAVFMHLQHWERIFNGFGHITSGITLELIACVVFVVALAIYFLMMRRADDQTAPKWCGWIFMVVGVALVAVTGDSYLMAAVPAWDTPLLIVFYICNMLALGGLATIIIALACKSDEQVGLAKKLATVGIIAQLIVLVIYAVYITNTSGTYTDLGYYFDPTLPDTVMMDITATVNILSGDQALMFWVGAIAVGSVLPLIMAFIMLKGREGKATLSVAAASLVCVVAGSICWRVILYLVAISIFAVY